MNPLFYIIVVVISSLAAPLLAVAQTKPAPDKVTLTGKIAGGKVAIGGETSGWELRYRDKTGEHSIEVEFSKAQLASIRDGQTVRIIGTIVTRERVERGAVRTLVAGTVEEVRPPK